MQEIDQTANPFPGLRPFESSETHLFFGRDGQSEELLRRLKKTRFLAVVGTSGSGKSSLVRAGLLPALQGGLMASAGSDWRIAILRPGGDPIGNLARALASSLVLGSHDEKTDDMQAVLAETNLRRSSLGLVELVTRARTKVDEKGQQLFADYENLLVVVDQFEELFRFKQLIEEENSKEDAAAFVKLLLEAVGQKTEKIYVVLTMRSDFLGDCSQFFELPEAINNGQYLIPRMTRDERREAISGPVAVGQGTISEPLVSQLLNDVGDNPDQLPIMQHALMRTWDHWLTHRNGKPIDIPDYNAIGGMAEALSRHADEAYAELDEREKAIAEKLFKGLTEKGTDNREIRRPMEVQEICELTGADEAAVIQVVEVFRREGRSFLMPPPTDALSGAPVHLNRDSLIDISHESLIRNWERLKTWVDEESRSARIYRRLAETAVLHKEGGAGLWRDPDLGVALTWREQSNPNQVWARRYHAEFPLAMSFLDESVAARDAQIAGEEARRRKEIKRTRLTALIFAVAFIFSLGMGVFAYGQRNEAVKQQAFALIAKDEAVAALKEAKEQRSQAQTQAQIAEERSQAAAESQEQAQQQSEIARAQSKEATHQKQVALGLNESLKEQIEVVRSARKSADDARETAIRERNLAVARQLRNVAAAEWNDKGEGLVRSSLLAVESLKSSWTPEGYEALARGLNLLPRPATKVWKAHDGPLLAMALSKTGRWLATKSTDGTRIWDVASQKEIKYLQSPQDKHMHVTLSFSPDDRRLVIGMGRFAYVWDTTTWKELKKLPNGEFVWSVDFSSDGSLLATAGYHSASAIVYETSTWTEIAKIKPTGLDVFSVSFVPNSRLLVTSANGGTAVWDVSKPQQRLAEIKSATEVGKPLLISPNGQAMALGGRNRDVGLWAIVRGAGETVQLKPVVREESPLSDDRISGEPEAFSSDGRYLVTLSGQSDARIWEMASGREVTRVVEDVVSARFSQDGKFLLTGHTDGMIRERLTDAKEVFRLQQTDKMNTVAYSPDGQWLATGSDGGQARVFQTNDWRQAASIKHLAAVSSVAFSPGSRWLITLDENTLQMFETGSWRKALAKRYEDEISTVAFSSDGQRLLAISKKAVQLFVLKEQNWREVSPMDHQAEPKSLFFSPDGKWLATVTAGHCDRYEGLVRRTTTRVWDMETGAEVAWVSHEEKDRCHKQSPDLRAPSGGGQALALESVNWQEATVVRTDGTDELKSRDGRWTAASFKFSKQVLLTATDTTGKVVKIAHEDVNGIDFSPDARWLATAGDDGTVRLWPLSSEDLIREACLRLPHNLSRDDRKAFLGDPDFPDTCPRSPGPKKE